MISETRHLLVFSGLRPEVFSTLHRGAEGMTPSDFEAALVGASHIRVIKSSARLPFLSPEVSLLGTGTLLAFLPAGGMENAE